MPTRRTARLLAAGIAVSFGASMLIAPPAGATQRITHRTTISGTDRSTPRQTLAAAKSLFTPSTPSERRRRTAANGGRDATMVLRDLAAQRADLPTAAERATAARILARPTDGNDPTPGFEPKYKTGSAVGSDCSADLCVHWVEDGTVDQVADDGNVTTVPAQAATTLRTMSAVYAAEVTRLGYHAPLSDGTAEGDGRIDVYLGDIGDDGLYGYCATDDPARGSTRQVSGYCVLDNDYKKSQFPDHTPTQNLQVTAAHEFFHLVQFGYDWMEDAWFMEGTAAWMEDELYDNVNDNLQYLAESPLSDPYVPLDYTSQQDWSPYGSWVFWKFLSEWQGAGSADDPSVVRDTWDNAVGTTYSTEALKQTLQARGSSFANAFTTFGTWGRDPGRYFSEGSSYPAARLDAQFALTRSRPSTGTLRGQTNHMGQSWIKLIPGSSLTTQRHLRLTVNLPSTSRGSMARVVAHKTSGAVTIITFALDGSGNGTRTFGFARSSVSSLQLDLVNASTRFTCNQGLDYSCEGSPVDDGLDASFSATAVR